MFPRRPEKPPKYETLPWEVYAKQGAIMGRSRGLELAKKYIDALEETWGGKPSTPNRIAAACAWIEEKAFEELANAPGWDSRKLVRYRFPAQSKEAQALDARIWKAFQANAVRAIREVLTKYGCSLRFLDMDAFLRYYRAKE